MNDKGSTSLPVEYYRLLDKSSTNVGSMSIPLLIEFIVGTRIEREDNYAPGVGALPIVGNGPPGTFLCFADGRRIPLPTDQIVSTEVIDGAARVGFGGLRFEGVVERVLLFKRVRDLLPERELSPERRSHMTLEPDMVASIAVDGELVWPTRH